ncbi:zinc-binding dehydrogenase [Streptomyces sp. NPDC087843]|uniref:zinc-binding dehydrogenase n=1 Tax=Streptomyces sp. NPDC087843 TaxID=3365804 RepID=UPI0037F1B6C9
MRTSGRRAVLAAQLNPADGGGPGPSLRVGVRAARPGADFILDTVGAPHSVEPYMAALAMDGTLCVVGIPESAIEVNPLSLIQGAKTLAGAGSGGTVETREMLDFCAEHGITAEIEIVRPDQVNEALGRLARNDVRYRFVLDMTARRP